MAHNRGSTVNSEPLASMLILMCILTQLLAVMQRLVSENDDVKRYLIYTLQTRRKRGAGVPVAPGPTKSGALDKQNWKIIFCYTRCFRCAEAVEVNTQFHTHYDV